MQTETKKVTNSVNLPRVDSIMISNFLIENANITDKTDNVISSRESYGDKSVGIVHIKREKEICNITAKISFELNNLTKVYNVEVRIDEKRNKILQCECKNCCETKTAKSCQHTRELLFWIHRHSEDAAPTSTCNELNSEFSKVGKLDLDFESIMKLDKKSSFPSKDPEIITNFLATMPAPSGILFSMYSHHKLENVYLYQLAHKYVNHTSEQERSAGLFIKYCTTLMKDTLCKEAENLTRMQSYCKEWFEMKFGRIIASQLYDAAECQTFNGPLLEEIMGSSADFFTQQYLVVEVLKEVEKRTKMKINNAGFVCSSAYPMFGATPNGITSNSCVVIKCPKYSDKYVENGKIKEKYLYELQMTMFICKKNCGLFCVASPSFETDRVVHIYEMNLEEELIKDVMLDALEFWKRAIYPSLIL